MNSYNTAAAQFIDQFQRRFTYLRLSITDACNSRCNYCLPNGYCPSGDESPLSVTEIENIIPFERDIYVAMLLEYLEREKERLANRNG